MKVIQSLKFLFLVMCSLTCSLSNAAETFTALQIIEKSDHVRNPEKPFRLENQLTEYDGGAVKSEVKVTVFSKEEKSTGQFKNVVYYRQPSRDSGKIVLLNGTTMWFYDPTAKSSVRISPQQRLVGQASEGDVVTVNFARDYTPKLIDETSLEDADHQKRNCWHLELDHLKDDAVYNKIEYWVEKDSFHPIKGKFYSDSGRLLKIAYYHKYQPQLGANRPTETIIIDAINPKLITTMNFSNYKETAVPDNWFQRDYLSHLKAD